MSIYSTNCKVYIDILKLKFYIKLSNNKKPTAFIMEL